MMKMVRIGTHNGHFHADEVLACALLKMLPKFKVNKQPIAIKPPGCTFFNIVFVNGRGY